MSAAAIARPRREAGNSDKRRDPRVAGGGVLVRSFWMGNEGEMQSDLVRVLNISNRGIALELTGYPMRNTVIRIEGSKIGVAGRATIRHIVKSGSKYVVGAEFIEGAAWRRAAGQPPVPKPEPAATTVEPPDPDQAPAAEPPNPQRYDKDDDWRWND